MEYTESDLVLRVENSIPSYFVSLNGQAKFYTLASMLLESAGIHSTIHGFGYDDFRKCNVYWVLSRLHVVMHSYPMMNQLVEVRTWHKGANRLFFMRDYQMFSEDEQLLASATTAWLILDGKTGRPKKLGPSDNFEEFSVKDRHAIETVPDKLPAITGPDRQVKIKAQYSDLDINQHVNALKYIEWIQDCYDEETYRLVNVKEFQINYQLETRFGEEVEIRMKNGDPGDPFDYFEGLRTGDQNPAFRARICFGKFI
jgi:acyl-ACP thioesterase